MRYLILIVFFLAAANSHADSVLCKESYNSESHENYLINVQLTTTGESNPLKLINDFSRADFELPSFDFAISFDENDVTFLGNSVTRMRVVWEKAVDMSDLADEHGDLYKYVSKLRFTIYGWMDERAYVSVSFIHTFEDGVEAVLKNFDPWGDGFIPCDLNI